MQPAARLQAAIEILDLVEQGIGATGAPADNIVKAYCRTRRYIGSKDRRAIIDLVYAVIRKRGLHMWRLEVVGLPKSGRSFLISHASFSDASLLELFGGDSTHAPAKLTNDEKRRVASMPATLEGAPLSARTEVPECVQAGLQERFGDQFEAGVSALNETAPLDIRLNPLKRDKKLINNLNNIDQDIVKSRYSPIGFRSSSKTNLSQTDMFRNGQIEVQDEAAQVACYLVNAEPGTTVVDLCAGAGGKSILVSALMENRGQLFAFDVADKRLANAKPRLQRAGCRNIQTRVIPETGSDRAAVLSGFKGKADRVIIDAPCSGSGTWRRNPDQRWRLSNSVVRQYADIQLSLLQEGATLVRAGGRLVYMTCSLLPDENEVVVDRFLTTAPSQWKLIDYRDVWRQTLGNEPAETASSNPLCMQLVPHKHQTDGFFVAIFEKSAI